MKKSLAWAMILALPLVLVAAVWQAGRSAALAAEARRLEEAQELWVQENEKLEAGIAVLSSRERAASLAKALGLVKAEPARRLRVDVAKPAKERSDG
ncbi:MAG TPA: cell division protein FtsL [Spirochaetales bacterium]|nr:cell division protein FtsL [Spirochaetales bacterium]HRY54108.1 cell division protein FtsL [Spirochaetia bacterium]HRZ64083.1 cell division protein FtsL [Spirochaetia bacterium]